MNIKTEVKKEHKDYYRMTINGVDMGLWETSQIRQHIEDLDKAIHH